MKKVYVFAALTWLVGCLFTGCTPVIVGDSISNMSRTPFAAAMPNVLVDAADGRGAYNPGVNGQAGTGLEAIAHNIQFVEPGGWLVVELGSNNIDFTHEQRMQFIKEVTDLVPDGMCLAWVTPYVMSLPAFGVFHDNAGWMNDITEGIRAQTCNTVIYWNLVAEANPEYLQDFVHPNALGQQALAFFIGIATSTYQWPPE